jgi:hypothetical protein
VDIVKLWFVGRGEEEKRRRGEEEKKFKSEVTSTQTASHKNVGLKEHFLNKDFFAIVEEFKYLNSMFTGKIDVNVGHSIDHQSAGRRPNIVITVSKLVFCC